MKGSIQNTINNITQKTKNYVIRQSGASVYFTISQLLLIVLSVIMAGFVIKHFIYYNVHVASITSMEGFTDNDDQNKNDNKRFILKKDTSIFDDFYSSIYDTLVFSDVKNTFELNQLVDHAVLDNHSKLLDVGCGTGHHIGQLLSNHKELNNENVVGIDISKSMINQSRKNYPKHKRSFQVANATNGTLFRENTFSHILCLYFTIYYIKDKYRFFKNCYQWLQGGGTLLLHLVDADKFDPIIPAGNPLEIINLQNYSDKRVTNSKVVFNGFDYQADFKYKPHKNLGKFVEKFMFKDGKTRENEHLFFMESRKDIINIARKAGFVLKKHIHMHKCGYENQYLYILEKQV